MAVEIKTLVHYPDLYFKKYATVIKNGFTMKDDKKTRDLTETFEMISCDDKSELRILAIGTGQGMVDEVIIDLVSARFKAVVYVVVEPAEAELQKFKDMVSVKAGQDQWKNVTFKFLCTTIEDFLDTRSKTKTTEGFDVIHTLHSTCHFIDPHGSLVELYGILDKGGMLFVMLVAGPWERTNVKIGEYYFDPKVHFFGMSAVREKFLEQIKDAKIMTKFRAKRFRINECFQEDSEDGNDMLDFIAQIPDFRKTVSKEVADAIINIIKENCEQSGDDIMFGADEEDMIAFKQ